MWQVTAGQSLAHRGWGDEFVIYNDLTGDTHLIGGDALALLLCLQEGARDEAALLAALAPDARDGDETLPVLLAELSRLALIEAV
jgi:PqqD family protein of HPr-rel-A system